MTTAKLLSLVTCIFIFTITLPAQNKRSVHWYFGFKAGIDFSSGAPVADTNSALASIEGSASISDTAGQLLFYTGSTTVFNRHHQPMPNGELLLADQSAVQSSLIVPKPGSDSLFYLFNTAALSAFGFRYSIIDMSLDNGNGDVVQKNVLLMDDTSATEELAGTMHYNYRDYWVVVRELVGNNFTFRAYRLAPDGLHGPVISSFALPNSRSNTIGSLTFSQDGSKLVFSSFRSDILIFNFNKRSGILTLDKEISMTNLPTYSTAFSPDNKKLYVSYWDYPHNCNLVQYDLTAPDISSTVVLLDAVDFSQGSPNGFGFIGQIRLAPDQKIYVSRWNQDHPFQVDPETFYSLDSLDVINTPNAGGLSCNFQRNAVYLQHKTTMLGLPNFISNFTNPEINRADSCKDFPVPVSLSVIRAHLQHGSCIVKWETLQELNTSHFLIERSIDAIHFTSCGRVNAIGTTASISRYTFNDPAPAKGISYYRLRMVDIDGKAQYSRIVKIDNGVNNRLQVYPNPFANNLYIQHSEGGGKVSIELRNLCGAIILSGDYTIPASGLIHLPLSNIAAGIYFMKLTSNENVSVVKLIK